MESPQFDLDELQTQMKAILTPLGSSTAVCCCSLIDPRLTPQQHLDDCELRLLDIESLQESSDSGSQDDGGTNQETDAEAHDRRRKHREAMARLRRGWRTSIAALQHQEKQLHAILRRMIVFKSNNNVNVSPGDENPLEILQRSYRDLVAEQIRLEEEHLNLEAARALREKYERLLERELLRVRLFHASTDDE